MTSIGQQQMSKKSAGTIRTGAPGGDKDDDKQYKEPEPATNTETPPPPKDKKIGPFIGNYHDLPKNIGVGELDAKDHNPNFALTPPPHLHPNRKERYTKRVKDLRAAEGWFSSSSNPHPRSHGDVPSHIARDLWDFWDAARREWRRQGKPFHDFSGNDQERAEHNNRQVAQQLRWANQAKASSLGKKKTNARGSSSERTPTKGSAIKGNPTLYDPTSPPTTIDGGEEVDDEYWEEDMEAGQILRPRRRGKKGDKK